MAKKKNEVATTKNNAVVDAGGFEEFAGAGMENVTADDILIPRLAILQDLSPQLKKTKSEFIEGASSGDICDLGVGDIFKEGVLFLPVYYKKEYLEWAPRSSDESLVNIHSNGSILDQCERNDKNQPVLPNGNLIVETAQFYGLNLSAGGRWSFIPMASTQLKKSRKWLTLANSEKLEGANGSFTPPLFYRTYNLVAAEESNNQGDWTGWRVERGLSLPEYGEEIGMDWQSIKAEAVKFRDQLADGMARGDLNDREQGASGSADPDGSM